MSLSDYDRQNVGTILNSPEMDWFRAKLFRLIAKADMQNRALLAQVYPEEVKLVCEYLGRYAPEVCNEKEKSWPSWRGY